ncbi:MAG: Uma2 family endonuclease [Planctomycetaceae bacterium]|nr:Uma2 family endonuclease [Planctomycetaceae bacterium]
MLNQILTPPAAAAVSYFRNIDARQILGLDGVTWEQYVTVADAFPGRAGLRITFDGERLELMTTSAPHERFKKLLGRLFETLTYELEIDIVCGGNTTFRREDIERGLEPDECCWVANEPAMRHLNPWDPSVHPPPDLAFEVDIASSSINRQEIYARLGVVELWRFDGERLHSLMLDSGSYVAVPASLAVPGLVVNELLPFLYRMQLERENAILRSFIDWINETLRAN